MTVVKLWWLIVWLVHSKKPNPQCSPASSNVGRHSKGCWAPGLETKKKEGLPNMWPRPNLHNSLLGGQRYGNVYPKPLADYIRLPFLLNFSLVYFFFLRTFFSYTYLYKSLLFYITQCPTFFPKPLNHLEFSCVFLEGFSLQSCQNVSILLELVFSFQNFRSSHRPRFWLPMHKDLFL